MTYEYEDKRIIIDESIRIRILSYYDNGYHLFFGNPLNGWYLDLSYNIQDGIVI